MPPVNLFLPEFERFYDLFASGVITETQDNNRRRTAILEIYANRDNRDYINEFMRRLANIRILIDGNFVQIPECENPNLMTFRKAAFLSVLFLAKYAITQNCTLFSNSGNATYSYLNAIDDTRRNSRLFFKTVRLQTIQNGQTDNPVIDNLNGKMFNDISRIDRLIENHVMEFIDSFATYAQPGQMSVNCDNPEQLINARPGEPNYYNAVRWYPRSLLSTRDNPLLYDNPADNPDLMYNSSIFTLLIDSFSFSQCRRRNKNLFDNSLMHPMFDNFFDFLCAMGMRYRTLHNDLHTENVQVVPVENGGYKLVMIDYGRVTCGLFSQVNQAQFELELLKNGQDFPIILQTERYPRGVACRSYTDVILARGLVMIGNANIERLLVILDLAHYFTQIYKTAYLQADGSESEQMLNLLTNVLPLFFIFNATGQVRPPYDYPNRPYPPRQEQPRSPPRQEQPRSPPRPEQPRSPPRQEQPRSPPRPEQPSSSRAEPVQQRRQVFRYIKTMAPVGSTKKIMPVIIINPSDEEIPAGTTLEEMIVYDPVQTVDEALEVLQLERGDVRDKRKIKMSYTKLGKVFHSDYCLRGPNETEDLRRQRCDMIFKSIGQANDLLNNMNFGKGKKSNFGKQSKTNFGTPGDIFILLNPAILTLNKRLSLLPNYFNVQGNIGTPNYNPILEGVFLMSLMYVYFYETNKNPPDYLNIPYNYGWRLGQREANELATWIGALIATIQGEATGGNREAQVELQQLMSKSKYFRGFFEIPVQQTEQQPQNNDYMNIDEREYVNLDDLDFGKSNKSKKSSSAFGKAEEYFERMLGTKVGGNESYYKQLIKSNKTIGKKMHTKGSFMGLHESLAASENIKAKIKQKSKK
jgi:hypothetical protein